MVDDPPSDDIQVEELEDNALEEVEREEDSLSQTLQSEIEEAVSSRDGRSLEDRPTIKRIQTTPPANSGKPPTSEAPKPAEIPAPPRSALPRPISAAPPRQRAASQPGMRTPLPSTPPSTSPKPSSVPAPSVPSPSAQPPRPSSDRPLHALAPRPGGLPKPPPPASRPPSIPAASGVPTAGVPTAGAPTAGKSLPPPRGARTKPPEPSAPSDLDEPTLVREEPLEEATEVIESPTTEEEFEEALDELDDLVTDRQDRLSDEHWDLHEPLDEVASPPEIPSLAQRDAPAPGPSTPKRQRNKKGKRRAIKIPDDQVPVASRADDDEDDDDFEDSDREGVLLPEPPDESKLVPRAAPIPRIEDIERPDYSEPKQGRTRESAPGIFTDEIAIGIVRPIMVVSDLPPVKSAGKTDIIESTPQPISVKRPPPPKRLPEIVSVGPVADELEDIEEIVPDRMSLPGFFPDQAPSTRRPLPPPRSAMASDPGLLVDIDIEPPPKIHPTGLDALAALEAEAAAAEAAAREAEARARDAEARARDAEARARDADRKDKEPAKDTKRGKKPWWTDWFEGDFIMTLDNPKRKDVERETNFIEESLSLDKGARILDLGCGHGVHAVELASRGYQVVGVDVSNTMLQLAKDYNVKRKTAVSFIQGDMRELNLEEVFDGIYCWQASFGYFDETRNINVLERVWRALRPAGRFVLDVPNRDYIAPRQPNMAWFERPGCVCMDEMKFDFYTSRLINKRMVMFDNGKSRELESSIRLYTLTELGRLLHNVGFTVLEVSGHRAHRGAYFGAESPRIIITAERREKNQGP